MEKEVREALDKLECNALNEAAWKLHDEIRKHLEISPNLFNNIKGCLAVAICEYEKNKKQ